MYVEASGSYAGMVVNSIGKAILKQIISKIDEKMNKTLKRFSFNRGIIKKTVQAITTIAIQNGRGMTWKIKYGLVPICTIFVGRREIKATRNAAITTANINSGCSVIFFACSIWKWSLSSYS
jgi:hypothetical protein